MIIDKTPELLVTLNPALNTEQETALRLQAVENSMSEIKNMVQMLTKKLL